MKVRDAMTTAAVTASSSMLLRDLWKLIIKKKVNSVLIVDSNTVLKGIIVREDLLSMIFPEYDEFIADFGSAADFKEMEDHVRLIGNKKTSEVMKTRIIFVHEDTELMRALSRMIVRHVDQLPVVSRNNTVLGIVTKSDIFSKLFRNRSKVRK